MQFPYPEDAPKNSIFSKIKGGLQLIRPLNALMFVFGVCLGVYLAAGSPVFNTHFGAILWSSLSALCIGCGANAINDLYDIEIDRINKPDRPIPAHVLTEQSVATIWGVLSISGLILAAFVSWLHFGIALLSVILLFFYSARLKALPFIGNLVVALVVGTGLLFGALIVEINTHVWFAFGFAFMTNLIREIIKDIEDVDGDMWGDAKTLAVVLGTRKTTQLVIFLIALLLIIGLTPYLLGNYSSLFLFLLLAPFFFLLVSAYQLWNAPIPQVGAKKASQTLKLVMLLGMIALSFR